MALIKCSECGKQVSNTADHCPNCGNPITGMSLQDVQMDQSSYNYASKGKKRSKLTLPLFILIPVAVFGIWFALKGGANPINPEDKNPTDTTLESYECTDYGAKLYFPQGTQYELYEGDVYFFPFEYDELPCVVFTGFTGFSDAETFMDEFQPLYETLYPNSNYKYLGRETFVVGDYETSAMSCSWENSDGLVYDDVYAIYLNNHIYIYSSRVPQSLSEADNDTQLKLLYYLITYTQSL